MRNAACSTVLSASACVFLTQESMLLGRSVIPDRTFPDNVPRARQSFRLCIGIRQGRKYRLLSWIRISIAWTYLLDGRKVGNGWTVSVEIPNC